MQPFLSRRLGRRRWLVFPVAIALFGITGTVLADTDGKAEKAGKGGRRKQKTAPSPGAKEGQESLTNIPLPVGHEAKGLTLPDFDLDGHLRGKFVAGSARRVDQDHINFYDLKITTFTPENAVDLQIDMQTSVLDLNSRILSSQERTTIRRSDFNIVGDSVTFDTNAHTSRMIGNVKMVISGNSHLIERPGQ